MGAQTTAPSSKTPSLHARSRTLTRHSPLASCMRSMLVSWIFSQYSLKALEFLGMKPMNDVAGRSDEDEVAGPTSAQGCTPAYLQVDSMHSHGGGIGTLGGLTAGGRSSAELSKAAASAAMSNEYALQSGKSYGKHGNPLCKTGKKSDYIIDIEIKQVRLMKLK